MRKVVNPAAYLRQNAALKANGNLPFIPKTTSWGIAQSAGPTGETSGPQPGNDHFCSPRGSRQSTLHVRTKLVSPEHPAVEFVGSSLEQEYTLRVRSRVVGALAFATEDLHDGGLSIAMERLARLWLGSAKDFSSAGSITLGCGIRAMSKCCATVPWLQVDTCMPPVSFGTAPLFSSGANPCCLRS